MSRRNGGGGSRGGGGANRGGGGSRSGHYEGSRRRGFGDEATLVGAVRVLEPGQRVRLFLAAELSSPAMCDLAAVAAGLRTQLAGVDTKMRWVAPVSYHVTLKFLGWCMPEVTEAIADHLAEEAGKQNGFDIEGRGLGAFPSQDRARVLWAGIYDPGSGLQRLSELCEDTLEPVGFAREQRRFHPHVTMARIKPAGDLPAGLFAASEQVFRRCRISALTLFESSLKSTGSEYYARARFGLEGAHGGLQRQTEALKRPLRADGT